MRYCKITTLILCLLSCASSFAQSEGTERIRPQIDTIDVASYTDEMLDTVSVNKKLSLNDYSMFGIEYGGTLSQVMWNPSQQQKTLFLPNNIGITFTTYGKMFGYMPFFGLQTGIFYGHEGYQFEHNENTGYTYKVAGAEKAIIEMVEVPVMSHLHIDLWNFKLIAQIGFYAGYRLSIERFPGETGTVAEEIRHSFLDTDRRFDYGIKGGAGVGLVFDPFEIHLQAMYKHAFASLYDPDYNSPYYYRYAYPQNIIISLSVHYHLTKRSGRTKAQIKKMAKDYVYGDEN